MALSNIVTTVQNRTGDTNISEADVTSWVNEALLFISNRYDWPWTLSAYETDTTTAGTYEYALQSDFKKMYSLRVGDAASTELTADEYSFLGYMEKNIAENETTDGTLYYYINPTNNKYGLIPTPDTTGYKVYYKYYATPTTISAVSATPDIPTRYNEALVNYALARYWEQNDEFDKVVLYDTKVENTIDIMYRDLIQSVGQQSRIKDVRELNSLQNPQRTNSIMLGK
jgi:hypothetical protein